MDQPMQPQEGQQPMPQPQPGPSIPHASSNPDPNAQPTDQDELKALTFSGPVPGQSLTDEPGNHPWENPPQFTDKEEAMNFLMEQITEPQHATEMFKLFRHGISVEEMTRVIIFTGFSQGQWNVDLGMLLYHPVMLSLIALANRAGLKDTPVVMKHRYADLEDKAFSDMQMMRQSEQPEEEATPPAPPPTNNGFMQRAQ